MLRRHPILLCAIFLLLLIGAGLLYVQSYLDAAHHHQRLQDELSAAFGHPVRLGEAAFTLRRGPALAVSDLHVDAAEAGFDLRAGLLYLRLEWGALLRGRVEFSRILLMRPSVHITLLPDPAELRRPAPSEPPSPGPLRSAVISSLAVEGGRLVVEDRRTPERAARVEVDEIDGEITDLAPGRSAWVHLSGRLPSSTDASSFVMAAEVTLPAEAALWRQTQVSLGLLSESFHPRLLEGYLPIPEGTAGGEGRLEITLEGSPAQGVRAGLRLAGSELTLRPTRAHPSPVPLPPIEGSAVWVAGDFGHLLRDISLTLDDIALHGEMSWREGESAPALEAKLSGAPFPLASLGRYLPDGGESLREVASGTLHLSKLHLEGEAGLLRDRDALLSALSAEASLHEGDLRLASTRLEAINAHLRLENGALHIEEGRMLALASPLHFSAVVEEIFSGAPSLRAEANGALESENLLPLLPPQTRERLVLGGPVPLSLVVTGGLEELNLSARAVLDDLFAESAPVFSKRAGEEGSLTLSAQASGEGWNLHFARLRLPDVELRANGFHPRGPDGLRLELHANAPDLQAARSLFPPLGIIDARGAAEVRGVISRSGKEWTREGTVYLRGGGLRPGVVARINEATGTLRLDETGMRGTNLSARLGTSPAVVDLELENFLDPRLHLHVRADAIRADEIIFPSPDAVLRDVDGHLTIERGRVGFSPVRVRLDGGTEAVVKGAVVDFSNPMVELDIRADYGDIDEVIALWVAPPREEGPGPPPEREINTQVRISAAVREGKIGDLNFEQAEGIISWRAGLLTVHPLHFQAAGGICTGRVMVESGLEGHMLSVSGHLIDAEAARLQEELLHFGGLVSGNLRGDFFVNGMIGDFRRTSRGGVHVEVEKGVLRRFSALSKIFSLLNISQIFSGKLPDMAREGMPFNRLSASFLLEEGLLQSEDLFIDSNSMNLSVVGELDLVAQTVDAVAAVKPLRTVDKVVSRIPVAGWVLTGEEEALITAHFQIRGPVESAEIIAVPVTSLSEKAIGIFRRIFGLPARFVEHVGDFVRPE